MKLTKLKTIFVDIDGTICTQHEHPDFADQPVDYSLAEPIPERIKIINELFDKGHQRELRSSTNCLTRDIILLIGLQGVANLE